MFDQLQHTIRLLLEDQTPVFQIRVVPLRLLAGFLLRYYAVAQRTFHFIASKKSPDKKPMKTIG